MRYTSLIGFAVLYFSAVTAGNAWKTLSYPKFSVGKTYVYDACINLTARIPGLHPQVSKRVLAMTVKIRAEKENTFALKIENVLGSGSISSVSGDTEAADLKRNAALESRLKLPITFLYQDGEVMNYTLDPKESLESQKIKRSILRNLQLFLHPQALRNDSEMYVTYSKTRTSPAGNYSSRYTLLQSRPQELVVLSRADDYEDLPYDAYQTHSNFMAQGCSKVCRRDQQDAPCPLGYESYERPTKKSFFQNHNLKYAEDGTILLDGVYTKETHLTSVYDQSMEIAIQSLMQFKELNLETIQPRQNQKVYYNLNNYSNEINEREIASLCGRTSETEAVATAKKLLQELSNTVVVKNLDNSSSALVGEKLVLLKRALTTLNEGGLRHVQEDIIPFYYMLNSSVTDIVKRQIWIDMLPVIGTEGSIAFITKTIHENVNAPQKSMSIYEASSILNAMPANILRVNDQMIRQLRNLLDLIKNQKQNGGSTFFSASHIALARTVSRLCSQRKDNIVEESEPKPKSERSNSLPLNPDDNNDRNDISFKTICGSSNVQEFFQHISTHLASTCELTKKIIYVETLARTGLLESIDILAPYVKGKISEMSPGSAEYLRIAALKALHSLVDRYPREIQGLVHPIFFNQSEPFVVRIPAFAVLIRSKPSLGLLQQVAAATWHEASHEVASYVTSALETFGNSTLPCGRLLAHRIKKVLPEAKRFGGDYHRSKSLMWSLFDDFRNFGLGNFFQFSANDDSLFPNTLYGALEYNVDSFRDFILQYSAQIQGFSASELHDFILKALRLKTTEPIPESILKDVFKQVNLTNKEAEPWRVSLYHKMFYSMSFDHIDGKDTTVKEFLNSMAAHLFPYFKPVRGKRFAATFVRVRMPSSYQSKAVGQAYPSRVQFQMENPILTALTLQVKLDIKHQTAVEISFQPSTYSSVIYTNQILSLGDCQNIGVYHESNAAFSFSVDFNFTATGEHFEASYRFPQVPETLFKYNSGAGTYTGKTRVTSLAMNGNRAPITTAITPYKSENKFKVMGSPPLLTRVESEDVFEDRDKLPPRGVKETMNYFIRKLRNSGWRNRTLELKLVPEEGYWTSDTEVSIRMNIGRIIRNIVSYQKTPIDQLIRELEIDEITKMDTVKSLRQEALILYNALDENFCHFEDSWSLNISKTGMSSNSTNALSWFGLTGVCKSSLTRGIYHTRAEFETKFFNINETIKASLGHALVNIPSGTSTITVEPETYQECLRDVEAGVRASVACSKARRDTAVYNKLKWLKTLSHSISNTKHLTDYIHQLEFPAKDLLLGPKDFQIDEVIKKYTNITANGKYIAMPYNRPAYDFTIKRSNESAKYRFPSNFLTLPLSSVESIIDTYLLKVTNNSYPATCVWMDEHVMTYDMKTYTVPDINQNCSYVMSAHCVKDKKFAVVVKTNFESNSSKEVVVYSGADVVSFGRVDGMFRFALNGRWQQLTPQSATLMMGGHVAFLADDQVLDVTLEGPALRFWYDGSRLIIKVGTRYKGELCGMCGQFDGDSRPQFRGLDGKLYRESSREFLETFELGECFKEEQPVPPENMSPEYSDISLEELENEYVQSNIATPENESPQRKLWLDEQISRAPPHVLGGLQVLP